MTRALLCIIKVKLQRLSRDLHSKPTSLFPLLSFFFFLCQMLYAFCLKVIARETEYGEGKQANRKTPAAAVQ